MQTQFCKAVENTLEVANIASKQLKALVEQLDEKTRADLGASELDAVIAKLMYKVEHLDTEMFAKGG